jgi:hypothetical protein
MIEKIIPWIIPATLFVGGYIALVIIEKTLGQTTANIAAATIGIGAALAALWAWKNLGETLPLTLKYVALICLCGFIGGALVEIISRL